MLKEYTLSDCLSIPSEHIAYYADRLELIKEPVLEWPHRQSFYSIIWFLKGVGFNVIDFNEHKIKQGRMFLVNPDQINNWSYSNNCEGYIIMFAKSLASQLGIDFLRPYIDIKSREASLLKLVLETLIKDFKSDKDESQSKIMISIQYFYSLIADRIHGEVFLPDKTYPVFLKFKELVLTSDFKLQSVDKYADTLHISTATLNSICQQFTGTSSKQLLLDLKMTEAKRLLLYSKLNINEISFYLGYEDSSYFSRIFRKKNRLCPTQFQEKYRK